MLTLESCRIIKKKRKPRLTIGLGKRRSSADGKGNEEEEELHDDADCVTGMFEVGMATAEWVTLQTCFL